MLALTDQIMIEHPLDIPDLSFRGFRGPVDYPLMVELINSSREVDKNDWVTSIEDIEVEYENLVNCDPYRDMLFAVVGGHVVAYSRVHWRADSADNLLYNIYLTIHPEWHQSGIGRIMLKYSENLLKQIAQSHNPTTPKYFDTLSSETTTTYNTLLEEYEYEPARYFYAMRRPIDAPLPEAGLPQGVEVRPVEDEHIDQILDATDEVFQDLWGYVPMTPQDRQQIRSQPDFDPSLWKIAWAGNQVVGTVINSVNHNENITFNRKRGYTDKIAVRLPYRTQGIARGLLVQSIQMFKNMGMEETALGVDCDNPNGALRLYESVGYRPYKQYMVYRKPME
jgi:ribosomal protein S18 acetylase RimI-like enzyme